MGESMEDFVAHMGSFDQSLGDYEGLSTTEHSYISDKDVLPGVPSLNTVKKNDIEDEAILSMMRFKTGRLGRSEAEAEFYVIRGQTKDEFMKSVLDAVFEEGKGLFCQCSHRDEKGRGRTVWQCERGNTSRAKERPKTGRAQGCTAYISFYFRYLKMKGLWTSTVRKKLQHTGHTLDDPQEMRKNRIHLELREYIESLLGEGKRPIEVMVSSWAWSQAREKFDFRDRRYYPIPEDIKTLRKQLKKTKKTLYNEDLKPSSGSVDPLQRTLYGSYIDGLVKAGRVTTEQLKPKKKNRSARRKKEKRVNFGDTISDEDSEPDGFASLLAADRLMASEIEIETIDYRTLAKQQLAQIYDWVESDGYERCESVRPILDQIETLHSTIFMQNNLQCSFQSY